MASVKRVIPLVYNKHTRTKVERKKPLASIDRNGNKSEDFYFNKKPWGYWNIKETRQYFDWLSESLSIQLQSDWYKIKVSDVQERGGRGILSYYFDNSLQKALSAVYPVGYFKNPKNKRTYVDWVAEELGIETQLDFYSLSFEEVSPFIRANVFLNYEEYTNCLKQVYPEFSWHSWLFHKTPNLFWEDKSNHRAYFDWLESELHLQNKDDWYKIKVKDVIKKEGKRGVLWQYSQSLIRALQTVYPEIEWHPWKFESCPRNFWDEKDNIVSYLQWLANHVGIEEESDWNRITKEQITILGGGGLIQRYGGLQQVLSKFFIKGVDITCSTAKSQSTLLQVVKDIPFHPSTVAENQVNQQHTFLSSKRKKGVCTPTAL